ncbi:branched-chain amino acid ABC transporter permease [Minwuia sp.]|uniref:branched-chain amino acid ABC transporter permease n=1 Tax=Minwuia sp. TaxID=2493630 RepID=UPI003A923DC1
MDSFQIYVSLLINGLSLGCIYGLIALGFVLIYKATEMVNFAQGDVMMVGAFVAFGLIGGLALNFWVGFLLTIVIMFIFGFLLDVVVIRRLIGQPQFSIVMATIGIGYVLRFVMPYAYNVEQIAFLTPFTGAAVQMGDITLDSGKLAAMGGTLVLCLVLYFFFQRTRIGVAMQASSQNQLASYYMGIPVALIFSLIWGISAGVAGVTGIMLMPIANVMDPSIGFIAIKAFAGAVVGGFGSIPGALVGGIIIGMVEQFSDYLLPAGYKDIAVYSVLLAVMVFRPEGIFSQMGRKKV